MMTRDEWEKAYAQHYTELGWSDAAAQDAARSAAAEYGPEVDGEWHDPHTCACLDLEYATDDETAPNNQIQRAP